MDLDTLNCIDEIRPYKDNEYAQTNTDTAGSINASFANFLYLFVMKLHTVEVFLTKKSFHLLPLDFRRFEFDYDFIVGVL